MYSNLCKDVEEVRNSHQEFKMRQENLSTTVRQLEKRLYLIEKHSRAKNLLIFKLLDNEDTNGNLYLSVVKLFNMIKAEIPDYAIESVYRLGRTKGKRPVMVRFISAKWKTLLFRYIMEDIKELGLFRVL